VASLVPVCREVGSYQAQKNMRCLFSQLPYILAFIPTVCTTYPTCVHLSWNEAYNRPPSAVMTAVACRVPSAIEDV
jgi:hypothetical protein